MTEANHSIVELGMAARRLRQGHADALLRPSPGLLAAVVGLNVSPTLTAALRAVAYIVLTLACDMAILYFTQTPPAALALYSALIIGALRALEGVADNYLKPDQNMTVETGG